MYVSRKRLVGLRTKRHKTKNNGSKITEGLHKSKIEVQLITSSSSPPPGRFCRAASKRD